MSTFADPARVNRAQHRALTHYNLVDPGCERLGYHRGRPVIYTFLTRRRDSDVPGLKRHVVVLQKNGLPGDLPTEWENDFVFDPHPGRSHDWVRLTIVDWQSWVVKV